MISRRTVIASSLLLPVLLQSQTAAAQELAAGDDADAIEKGIRDWAADESNAPYFEVPGEPGKGSLILPPDDSRVKKAAQLLAASPRNVPPIEIAKSLIKSIPANWRMEWPRDKPGNPQPANPIIVAFFAATGTQPYAGDETAWCAAFMCWAIERAGLKSTNSAGSKSFRSWAKKVTDGPKVGDVVVFKNKSDPIFGHVGFFDGFASDDKSSVFLIGGNQGDTLKRAAFGLNGKTLELVSYRTTDGLRV